jgi:membrane-bound serine protease (ClpP class)
MFLSGFFLAAFFSLTGAAGVMDARVITLNDKTVNPVTAEYIINAIDRAQADGSRCLIIELDTPGGLLNSTRSIVKRLLTAEIPVVVYISPAGSRAGSAGVFITYASHIAAMAPSTNIGAAHPVQMGGADRPDPKDNRDWRELKEMIRGLRYDPQPSGEDAPAAEDGPEKTIEKEPLEDAVKDDQDPMSSKILNDTVAFIRAIAQERGRNAQWAVQSVVKSESITSDEALEKGVVEIIASDLQDLLAQLDGREVSIKGKTVILKTRGASVTRVDMDARQKFFNVLADPNIAYFLLILGFYGLLFEMTHPGIGVPGVLGAIFLILALYSMQTLPTNYAGLALMSLGLILLVAEAYAPGFGLLTLGGMVCLALGSMLLFESVDPVMRVSRGLIFGVTASFGGLMIFLAGFLFRNRRRPAMGGKEGMVGLKGKARTALKPGTPGQILVHGEIWSATADEPVSAGEAVEVESVEGLVLKVKRLKT